MIQSLTHSVRLPNGITLITTENPAADIVAARLFIRAGTRWESPQQLGLSHLLAAVMTKGTYQWTAMEIAEKVESVGASLGTDASADYFVLSLKTVTADFEPILALAQEILCQPSLSPEQVELERQLTLQSIRAQQERPFTVAYDHLRRQMYGGHPYGTSILGTTATVSTLTPDDLKAYHQCYFRPDNLVISICGRITSAAAIALAEKLFRDWSVPPLPLPSPPVVTLPDQAQIKGIVQETQQSIIMLGYPAASIRQQSDYLALKLLNTYLGNGLSSRLFVELREKRGLAYDVSAFYPTRCDCSQFVAYIGTAPENTATAHAGLQAELHRLVTTPLSDAELQMAKNKLLGQYALGKQTNAEIAQLLGWYETLGLGMGFDADFAPAIAQITAEQLQVVAETYINTTPHLTVVGPATALETIGALSAPHLT